MSPRRSYKKHIKNLILLCDIPILLDLLPKLIFKYFFSRCIVICRAWMHSEKVRWRICLYVWGHGTRCRVFICMD